MYKITERTLGTVVFISLMTVAILTSCQKPAYDCVCTSAATNDSFHTLQPEPYDETQAQDWCEGIEADTVNYDCVIHEVYK